MHKPFLQLEQEDSVYCEGGQTLEGVSQRGCEVFTLEDNQNLTVHSAEHHAQADFPLDWGLDQMISRSAFPSQ